MSKDALVSIDDAINTVMRHTRLTGSEMLPLSDALGRVIYGDQQTQFDIPPHNHAAMDGYAFASGNPASVSLRVCGSLAAGEICPDSVPAGAAVRIMTGAPMPEGCDTVAPFEDVAESDGIISFSKSFSAGDNVRRKGEDSLAGETLVRSGTLLRPQEIALLAAMNIPKVPVACRPRGALLSTGDELLEPGSLLLPGKIINSNSSALAAMLVDAGAEPLMRGIARDTLADTTEKLASCLDAELILVSGGASAGDRDHVCRAVSELGGEVLFSGVSIKPGKPFGFAIVRGIPLFIMPGNPVAAMVTFELFVRPMLLASMGLMRIFRPRVKAVLSEGFKNRGIRPHFAGAILEAAGGLFRASITGSQSSGRILSLTQGNALLFLRPETVYRAGDTVDALLTDSSAFMESICRWD